MCVQSVVRQQAITIVCPYNHTVESLSEPQSTSELGIIPPPICRSVHVFKKHSEKRRLVAQRMHIRARRARLRMVEHYLPLDY